MRGDELDVEVLGRVGMGRRAFIKRIVVGTAFAVPAIQSLDLAGLSVASAADCGLVNTITARTSPNPSTVGQAVTLTATQTSASRAANPSADPSDFVEFFDGVVSLGRVPFDQNPTSLVVTTLTQGPHSITAFYSGSPQSPGFCPITSQPVIQVVNGAYVLAVDAPAVVHGAEPAVLGPAQPTGGDGTSPLPAALIAGSGLAAAAAAFAHHRRPAPQDG